MQVTQLWQKYFKKSTEQSWTTLFDKEMSLYFASKTFLRRFFQNIQNCVSDWENAEIQNRCFSEHNRTYMHILVWEYGDVYKTQDVPMQGVREWKREVHKVHYIFLFHICYFFPI